jgi:vancomycin permeability regulator SanA
MVVGVQQPVMNQRIRRFMLIGSAVLVSMFILSASLIVADGLTDRLHRADVAIVLGNTVNPDGLPSPRLKSRLDKAVELFNQGFAPNLIVSGGVGREGFDEAEVMKRYLIDHGVPPNRILVDSFGLTTCQTAKNSSRLMKENGWQSAIVVTQYFHVSRTKLALSRNGVYPVYSAHAQFYELRDLYSIAREVVGFYAYLLMHCD